MIAAAEAPRLDATVFGLISDAGMRDTQVSQVENGGKHDYGGEEHHGDDQHNINPMTAQTIMLGVHSTKGIHSLQKPYMLVYEFILSERLQFVVVIIFNIIVLDTVVF